MYADENTDVSTYEYQPMIREGVTWLYQNNRQTHGQENLPSYLNITIKGDTEIDEVVYKNCWMYADGSEFDVKTAMLVAYLREENKKVNPIKVEYLTFSLVYNNYIIDKNRYCLLRAIYSQY